jgi:hypothetical protein
VCIDRAFWIWGKTHNWINSWSFQTCIIRRELNTDLAWKVPCRHQVETMNAILIQAEKRVVCNVVLYKELEWTRHGHWSTFDRPMSTVRLVSSASLIENQSRRINFRLSVNCWFGSRGVRSKCISCPVCYCVLSTTHDHKGTLTAIHHSWNISEM